MALPSDSPLRTQSAAEVQRRLELERSGGPHLIWRDADGAQQDLVLHRDAGGVTVGRSPSCGVPLAWDGAVSRVHCELQPLGDGWAVADDGISRNGTHVNGRRIEGRRRLEDGDVIAVGDSVVLYRVPEGDVGTGTVAASSMGAPEGVTPAQRRVLVELCRPLLEDLPGASPPSNRQIAEALIVGEETVKSHLQALYPQFGVDVLPAASKRTALADLAVRTGAVTRRDLG